MTAEELRDYVDEQRSLNNIPYDVYSTLVDGIDTIEQESKADAFDEIRAKIIEEKELAYADFERYKVEYLGQDWEDVYDSLPNDDFRYGMERTIEIIDKYKESEESDADSN